MANVDLQAFERRASSADPTRLEPYQARVHGELLELLESARRLSAFIESPGFALIGATEQHLLRMQVGAMTLYAGVLMQRINRFLDTAA